jgi:hypothetical protein
LVSGGSIFGVWFNSAKRQQLHVDAPAWQRIRKAIKNAFYPHRYGVFFHEGMSEEEHREGICRMLGETAS